MPRITIRLEDSEYERIGQNATKAGITISEYVRRKIAGHRIEARRPLVPISDRETVKHLASIGGLLKQLWKEGRGADAALFATLQNTLGELRRRMQ